jgi:DNA damage-inducible protein 1
VPQSVSNHCSNRPRVTISINAPNEAADQDLLTLDVSSDLTVKDLKALIEADTTFPTDAQNLFLNGRPLSAEAQTLADAGVKDGEMLAVLIRRRGTRPQGQREMRGPAPSGSSPGDGRRPGAVDPETVRLRILNDPATQASLRQQSPQLLDALHDPARWRQEWEKMQRMQEGAERERQNQIALLNEDPFNIDAQRKIEEIIRHDRIMENLQQAIEENPEGVSSPCCIGIHCDPY